jgi:chlorophyllide a reductase subunit X
MTAPARRQAFAEAVGIPVLAAIPQDDDIRRKSANYQIIGTRTAAGARCSRRWPPILADAPPVLPEPLDQDGLLNLFDSSDTGGDVRACPGLAEDMCPASALAKSRPSKSSTTRCDDHGRRS